MICLRILNFIKKKIVFIILGDRCEYDFIEKEVGDIRNG